jgi:membrane protein YdbS with pleckstrin-like domain
MIYASAFMAYNTLFLIPNGATEQRLSKSIGAFVLVLYCIAVTGIYLYIKNPVFHEVSFAILTAIMVLYPLVQIPQVGKLYPGILYMFLEFLVKLKTH